MRLSSRYENNYTLLLFLSLNAVVDRAVPMDPQGLDSRPTFFKYEPSELVDDSFSEIVSSSAKAGKIIPSL